MGLAAEMLRVNLVQAARAAGCTKLNVGYRESGRTYVAFEPSTAPLPRELKRLGFEAFDFFEFDNWARCYIRTPMISTSDHLPPWINLLAP